jgi:DNA-directed RNA polymerase omega subunit
MIEPKIDDLLAAVDSKYTLVILAAKRAREINSYYSQLGAGRAEFIPPLIESGGLTISRYRSPSKRSPKEDRLRANREPADE